MWKPGGIMNCPLCKQGLVKAKQEIYCFKESGLNNVFLKNIPCFICACGTSPILPLNMFGPINYGIIKQLVTKPNALNHKEFVFLIQIIRQASEDNANFAKYIGFKNISLIKFNDFSKIDISSPQTVRESSRIFLNSENDGIINEQCADEIDELLAIRLGFKTRFELRDFCGQSKFKPVHYNQDFKIRELAEQVLKFVKVCESYSEFEGDYQKVFIELTK